MRQCKVLLLAMTLIFCVFTKGYAQAWWPANLPDGLRGLHQPGNQSPFLLTQAIINDWATWEQQNDDGVIHLVNQNINGLNPWYESVDYIVLEDIVFGQGGANANLVIDAGVTVWFALEPTNQEVDQVDQTEYLGDGAVVGACTFIFNIGSTLTCGDVMGAAVTLEPWPFLMDFLLDYDNYPASLPGVSLGNDFWEESRNIVDPAEVVEFGAFFAGGLILKNSANNVIENTNINNFIGGPLENSDFVAPWYGWIAGIGGENADADNCFGIKVAEDNTTLAMENVTILRATFNGIYVCADECVIDLTSCIIDRCWLREPEEHVNDRFCPPNATSGLNPERITSLQPTTGNGIYISGSDVELSISDTDIIKNSLRGVVLTGDCCEADINTSSQIGYENFGNGRNGERLFLEINTGINEANDLCQLDPYLSGVWIEGESDAELTTLTLNASHIDANRGGVRVSGGPHELSILNSSSVDINVGDEGDGINLRSGGHTLSISNSSIDGNASQGIDIEGSSDENLITIASSASVNENDATGILIDDWSNGNTINILNSTVSLNGMIGVHINGNTNAVNLDNSAEIQDNSSDGIRIEYALDSQNNWAGHGNTISLQDHSSVSSNGFNGISIKGFIPVDGDPRYEVVDNTVIVNNFSQINDNSASGVCFRAVNYTDWQSPALLVNNSSTVSENHRHGVEGWSAYRTMIRAQNTSHIGANANLDVEGNTRSGVLFDWAEIEDLKNNVPPAYCADCTVELLSGSTCNENEGDDDHEGGIVLLGFGHAVLVDGNSSVNQNGFYGIRVYSADRSNVVVSNSSEVCGNEDTGISVICPELVRIDESEVSNNGDIGVFTSYWAQSRLRTPADPRENLGGNCFLKVDVLDNSLIDSNADNGIVVDGNYDQAWIPAEVCEVFIDNSTVSNSGVDGVNMHLLFNSDVRIIESSFDSNAEIGVKLDDFRVGGSINVLGSSFTHNDYGIKIEDCANIDVTIAPSESGVLSEFGETRLYDVHLTSINQNNLISFLIEKTYFYQVNPLPLVMGTYSHIFLRGRFAGLDDSFATVRQCHFEGGRKGVYLVQEDPEGEPDPPADPHPDVVVRNNFFHNLIESGIEVDFVEPLDLEENIIRLHNNTFKGDLTEVPLQMAKGIDLNPTADNPPLPALGDDHENNVYTIFNNIFTSLDIAIDQQAAVNPPDPPIYINMGYFDNDTDFQNCDGDNDQVPFDPLFVGDSERLSWLSPCINEGWNGIANLFEDSTLIDAESDLWYRTINDIGCTGGGAFTGILDHASYNVVTGVAHIDENTDQQWDGFNDNEAILPPDDYEILDELQVDNGYHLELEPNTAFFLHEDAEFDVYYGSIEAEGWDNGQKIYFGRAVESDEWYRVRLYKPDDICRFTGCIIEGGFYPLYLAKSTGVLSTVEVEHCAIRDAGYNGIYVSGLLKLKCSDTEIVNADRNGIYFFDNTQEDIGRSELSNVQIWDCCSSVDLAQGGISCYDSNPIIEGCLVYHNDDHGIRLSGSTGSEPSILGDLEHDLANNILNNGTPNSQSSYFGAEIFIADENSLTFEHVITDNNIYDVRDNGGGYAREGYIVASCADTDIELAGNYFGDALQAEHGVIFNDLFDVTDDGDDLSSTGDGDLVVVANDVEGAALPVDHWEATLDDDPIPANAFEAGVAHMRNGHLNEAIDQFYVWLEAEPTSNQARAAARALFYCQKSLGCDLAGVRDYFLDLAVDVAENAPKLSWMANKLAVKCSASQGQFERVIVDCRELQEIAPNEIERLYLEIEILAAEDNLNVDRIDGVGSNDIKIGDIEERIGQLLAENFEKKLEQNLPETFSLSPVYPNPFNASVRIDFTLPAESLVRLNVYSSDGRLVGSILDGTLRAGHHKSQWTSPDLPTGLYFLKMEACGQIKTQKMVLVK